MDIGITQVLLDLDSDMLRALSQRDLMLKKDPYYDFSNMDISLCPLLFKYHQDLAKIMDLVERGFFFLGITETVFRESHYSKTFQVFMEKYCYCPDHDFYDDPQYIEQKHQLAQAYTTIGDPPPMQAVYSAAQRKRIAPNDAYIMAEATLAGGLLLTGNLKHFCFDPKINEKNSSRVSGIINVNIKMRYDSGFESVSKPISAKTLGYLYDDASVYNPNTLKQMQTYPTPCSQIQFPYYK